MEKVDQVIATIARKAYIAPELVTPITAFASNLSEEIGTSKQTVNVPILAAGAAKTLTVGSKYVCEGDLSTTDVKLTDRLYSGFDFEDETFKVLSDHLILNTFSAEVRKILATMNAKVAAAVKAGVTNTAEFAPTLEGLAALKSACSNKKMFNDLVLVLKPETYDKLAASKELMQLIAISGKDTVTTGVVPSLLGFKIVRTNADQEFVAYRDAIAVAARATPATTTSQTIIDEASGFALNAKVLQMEDQASVSMIAEAFFGCKIVDATRIIKLTAPTTVTPTEPSETV